MVDVCHALAGVGLPKWPNVIDLDWLVELCPLLNILLQSDYEDYLLAALATVGSVMSALNPLFHASREPLPPGVPPSRCVSALVCDCVYVERCPFMFLLSCLSGSAIS